jgi:uncharacterized cupin superfamily protein
MAVTFTQGHVAELFQGFADDARDHATQEPLGHSETKLAVPEGEQEAIYNLWAAPDGQADLHVWLAKPGIYHVDGADRPNFFEVTTIMAGACTAEEEGYEPVALKAGDTYVMRPGWTGDWVVTEYVEKSFTWVYLNR